MKGGELNVVRPKTVHILLARDGNMENSAKLIAMFTNSDAVCEAAANVGIC